MRKRRVGCLRATLVGAACCRWAGSALGLPFRGVIRRRLSTRIDVVPDLPIYLAKCGQDLRLGWTLCERALDTVQGSAPIWAGRIPRLFRSLIIMDRLACCSYNITDKSCCINPWNIVRHVNISAAPTLIGSWLIWAASIALISEGRFGSTGLRHRKILAFAAQRRFLRGSLGDCNDLDIQAMINVLGDYTRE
jgi:hypothetical protein